MFHKKELSHLSPSDIQPRILRFPNPSKNNPQSSSKISPNESYITPVKQSSKPHDQLKNQISHQYAYDLLVCQMELQISEDITRDLVTKLFQLYKKGIQYYNLRQDRRQQYFKRKLQSLTIHPSVLKVLRNDNQKPDNFYKKRHFQRLMELNSKNTNQSINTMLRVVEQKDKINTEQIKKSISTQHQQIKQRIEKRRIASRAAMSIQDNNNIFQENNQLTINDDLFLKANDQNKNNKKKAIHSFGVSENRQQQNMDDYFMQKFVDI